MNNALEKGLIYQPSAACIRPYVTQSNLGTCKLNYVLLIMYYRKSILVGPFAVNQGKERKKGTVELLFHTKSR